LKSIISIFFACLVLLTNLSLSLATHYCGGKLVKQEISFGEKDLSCGMTTSDSEFCESSKLMGRIVETSCCEDHQIFWDVEDRYRPESMDFTPGWFQLSFNPPSPTYNSIPRQSGSFILRVPDPPGVSLQILNQVFRL